MSLDSIMSLLEDFDLAALIPEVDTVLGKLELAMRICVMIGPLVLLGLGLWYFLAPPREANHRAGFRTLWGMGSVEAWLFTQKLAGIVFSALGLLLTVIMAVICTGFRGMEAMDMAWSAIKCILWQVGLALVGCIGIHAAIIILFDWDGNRRRKKEK